MLKKLDPSINDMEEMNVFELDEVEQGSGEGDKEIRDPIRYIKLGRSHIEWRLQRIPPAVCKNHD